MGQANLQFVFDSWETPDWLSAHYSSEVSKFINSSKGQYFN